jgi:hypothetical protein
MELSTSMKKRLRGFTIWMVGLTVASISVTALTLVAIIIGFGPLKWMVIPLAIRGTVVAAWLTGLTVVATVVVAFRIKSRKSLAIIVNVICILSVLSCIMVTVCYFETQLISSVGCGY